MKSLEENKQACLAKSGELFYQREQLNAHLQRTNGDLQVLHSEIQDLEAKITERDAKKKK
jgi:hypothetical protein